METPFEKPPTEQPEANQHEQIKLPTRVLPLEERDVTVDDYTLSTFKTLEERARYSKVLDRKRFWNMLVSTVERTGYKPLQERPATVLDLGCGKCEEGIVLNAFFGGGNFGSSSENVKLIGVDIKQKDIERAINSYSSPDFSGKITKYVLPPNYEFIVGDATNLDQYQQIPGEVDVVVIRHEQISDNEVVWTKIFGQALQRVSKEGIIIITSFSDVEHKTLIEALQKLDCEIVINERNPYAKQLSHPKVSLDRNITIIRKKNFPPNRAKLGVPPRAERKT